MMRRRGGPGIVSTMATTAVVAGTAGAVHHRQNQRYMNKAMTQQTAYENQAQMADLQAQMQAMQAQQAAAAMTPPVSTSPDVMTQLQQLASMKAQGLLTDAQFEAAKSKLLGI